MRIPSVCNLVLLGLVITLTSNATAGIVQWRVRVPTGAENPNLIGSYTNTIEIENGGTTGYDPGLDINLDTSIVPNTYLFVSYIDQGPEKIEYEFTQQLSPGETYTAHLSFENPTGGFFFTPTTVEFLAADGDFSYELNIDTNDNGSDDTWRSGIVSNLMDDGGAIEPWSQLIFQGNDHRNGWYFAELTLTAIDTSPPINADFDSSGAVDGKDLALWRNGVGSSSNATLSDGDTDSDRDVDGRDFLNWQRHLGEVSIEDLAFTNAGMKSVPEPQGIAAMLIAISLLVTGRTFQGQVGFPLCEKLK